MFGLGPMELILVAVFSVALLVTGGVVALVFIKRPGNRTIRKDS